MKKTLFTLILIGGTVSITLIFSCKKSDNTTSNSPGNNSSSLDNNSQTFNDDANYYKSENDNANNDVNTDLSNYSNMQGRLAKGGGSFQTTYPRPCGCSNPDTSQLTSQKKIIYNFDGTTNCWGRHRSGTIIVQLTTGNRWSDSGAVLTFTFSSYMVTRLYDNKSITFNGIKTLKNVNGSNLIDLAEFYFLGTRTIKLRDHADSINVNFSGGLHAVWYTAYTTEWSHDTTAKLFYYTATGDTSVGGYSNVYAWGTDRFAQQFYSHTGVNNPVVCNSQCGYIAPMSGQVIHNVNNSTLTITLGVNPDGSHYSGNSCPWGFNAAWVLPNSNGNANFMYW